jgi:hypothetical protein
MKAILDEQKELERFFDLVQDAEDAVGAKCHDIEVEEDEPGFTLSGDYDANVDPNEFAFYQSLRLDYLFLSRRDETHYGTVIEHRICQDGRPYTMEGFKHFYSVWETASAGSTPRWVQEWEAAELAHCSRYVVINCKIDNMITQCFTLSGELLCFRKGTFHGQAVTDLIHVMNPTLKYPVELLCFTRGVVLWKEPQAPKVHAGNGVYFSFDQLVRLYGGVEAAELKWNAFAAQVSSSKHGVADKAVSQNNCCPS